MVRLFLEYISSKLILDQCLAKASFLLASLKALN
jgi:hypothetical protein